MFRQFTSTVYILERQKILLIYHRKFRRWHPPGGHLEPNETPCEAAVREAREETGLDVELVHEQGAWRNEYSNARSLVRPLYMILAYVKAHGDQPDHEHIDLGFLARPIGGREQQAVEEVDGLRWFSHAEIATLDPQLEIFPDVRDNLLRIMR